MSKNVLIADSNALFLKAMRDVLSQLGFDVAATVTKVSQVTTTAQSTKPDLLIFDYFMSTRNGAGFSDLIKLKERLPNIKILALGYNCTFDEFMEKYGKFGFDGYWNKYDTLKNLKDQLERALGQRLK